MSATNKLPIETPREWFEYAEGDLRVAELSIRADTLAYHTGCFLCQAAAEKFLKGFLIACGWELQKTHDILVLLAACVRYDAKFGGLLAEGQLLNDYITAGRYPGDIGIAHIGQAEAEEAVQAAKRIRALVLELFNNANKPGQ